MHTVTFPSGSVNYYFKTPVDALWDICDRQHTIFVTDEHVLRLYPHIFEHHRTLVVGPAESAKNIQTIERLAKELVQMEATRKTMLVGVGGGIVTDITGFLATVYMRGVVFGFVPTTLLGMVDAAVGGKNGVNVGYHKNMLGAIRQPHFILFDTRFLDTLADDEWSNGFAEVIKYACIFDPEMFEELRRNNISYYKDHSDDALQQLIEKCVGWKNKTVKDDEREGGLRKLLNFGHTTAHAIENLYEISHGKAVGIGMVIACKVSTDIAGLDEQTVRDVEKLLSHYHLPVSMKIDVKKAMEILSMDKKRNEDMMDFIVLEQVGKAAVRTLPLTMIEKALAAYESNN